MKTTLNDPEFQTSFNLVIVMLAAIAGFLYAGWLIIKGGSDEEYI